MFHSKTTLSRAWGAALLSALFSAASACGDAQDPNPSNDLDSDDDAIVGGRDATGRYSYPAVGLVLITREGADGRTVKAFCTGTLIGPSRVLTARHCITEDRGLQVGVLLKPRDMFFVLKNTNMEALWSSGAPILVSAVDGFKFRATSLKLPKGQFEDSNNLAARDVGLMDFEVNIQEETSIAPMGLAEDLDANDLGTSTIIVGYGLTSAARESGAGTKRYATGLQITGLGQDILTLGGAFSDKGTCSGDSGGPVFAGAGGPDDLIVGVTSWGDADCLSTQVYARADIFRGFFDDDATTPDVTSGAIANGCPAPEYSGCVGLNVLRNCVSGTLVDFACAGTDGVCSSASGIGECRSVAEVKPVSLVINTYSRANSLALNSRLGREYAYGFKRSLVDDSNDKAMRLSPLPTSKTNRLVSWFAPEGHCLNLTETFTHLYMSAQFGHPTASFGVRLRGRIAQAGEELCLPAEANVRSNVRTVRATSTAPSYRSMRLSDFVVPAGFVPMGFEIVNYVGTSTTGNHVDIDYYGLRRAITQ